MTSMIEPPHRPPTFLSPPRDDRTKDRLTITTTGCARCHGAGHTLAFRRLRHPVVVPGGEDCPMTHWAICPATGEPVLMGWENT